MSERYLRHEEIGKGGVGTVYKGTHKLLKRSIAIKEIKEIFNIFGDLQKDEIIKKFESAVQSHARLIHSNIIQIIDIDVDQQYPFFVMEYAGGGSLRERLLQKSMSLEQKIKCFIDIAQSLQYAHSQKVLHTNLKPENVLFGHDERAKLVDFGINRLIDRDMSKQQIYIGVGTVAYLAPEQFRNPQDANEKSDIYSLGIIFYEMLTGKLPGRRSPMPSSFFPELPKKLDDIFDNMCMDSEEDRYESVEQILNDLLSDREISAVASTNALPSYRGMSVSSQAPSVVEVQEVPQRVIRDEPPKEGDDNDILAKLSKYSQDF